MRRTLAIGVLIVLYTASAVLLITKAQVFQNCHDIFSCTTATGTNNNGNTQCTISVSIHACDGTQPGGGEACVNTGCVLSVVVLAREVPPTGPALQQVGSIVIMCSDQTPGDAVVVHARQRANHAMRTTPVVPD
jgi:hypothetical protein